MKPKLNLEGRDTHGEVRRFSFLRRVYAGWMRFARFLAYVNTMVVLTSFYFLVIGPVALFFKLIGKDLLDRKAEKQNSYWYDKPKVAHTIESTRHQF